MAENNIHPQSLTPQEKGQLSTPDLSREQRLQIADAIEERLGDGNIFNKVMAKAEDQGFITKAVDSDKEQLATEKNTVGQLISARQEGDLQQKEEKALEKLEEASAIANNPKPTQDQAVLDNNVNQRWDAYINASDRNADELGNIRRAQDRANELQNKIDIANPVDTSTDMTIALKLQDKLAKELKGGNQQTDDMPTLPGINVSVEQAPLGREPRPGDPDYLPLPSNPIPVVPLPPLNETPALTPEARLAQLNAQLIQIQQEITNIQQNININGNPATQPAAQETQPALNPHGNTPEVTITPEEIESAAKAARRKKIAKIVIGVVAGIGGAALAITNPVAWGAALVVGAGAAGFGANWGAKKLAQVAQNNAQKAQGYAALGSQVSNAIANPNTAYANLTPEQRIRQMASDTLMSDYAQKEQKKAERKAKIAKIFSTALEYAAPAFIGFGVGYGIGNLIQVATGGGLTGGLPRGGEYMWQPYPGYSSNSVVIEAAKQAGVDPKIWESYMINNIGSVDPQIRQLVGLTNPTSSLDPINLKPVIDYFQGLGLK